MKVDPAEPNDTADGKTTAENCTPILKPFQVLQIVAIGQHRAHQTRIAIQIQVNSAHLPDFVAVTAANIAGGLANAEI